MRMSAPTVAAATRANGQKRSSPPPAKPWLWMRATLTHKTLRPTTIGASPTAPSPTNGAGAARQTTEVKNPCMSPKTVEQHTNMPTAIRPFTPPNCSTLPKAPTPSSSIGTQKEKAPTTTFAWPWLLAMLNSRLEPICILELAPQLYPTIGLPLTAEANSI